MSGSAAARLARLADGYLVTQLLYACVALGVPDALAAGPRSADELARQAGAGPAALLRVLRGLAAEEVLDELPDGRFALTATGGCLRTGVPTQVPAGADAHLLSRVLHDWDDDDARRILRSCRAAMRPDSVLLVVEAVAPERAVDDPAAVRMDLHMLVLLHGRERTAAEYGTLLDAAGLRLARDVPTGAGVHVLEATPR